MSAREQDERFPREALDAESRRWIKGLRPTSRRYHETVADLHALLLRVARHEVARRRELLGSVTGPELDDLAQQSADDAVVGILGRLDEFRGVSRFTTWAIKFAIFEAAGKVARHAWRRYPPEREPTWHRLPATPHTGPAQLAEHDELVAALEAAIDADLTPQQRRVFVAVALHDVPIDLLALRLGTNRNAVYKNLHDARRRLRASLAAAGHPLTAEEALM